MKRPKRYPYSGKRRIFEKTILRVGCINASNIKSNNSKYHIQGRKDCC